MWTTKTKTEIIELYKNLESISSIARKYECSNDKVRYLLTSTNNIQQRKRHSIHLPESDIISLYKIDISVSDIAVKYGVSEAPIVSILKKHNVRKPNWLKHLRYSDMLLMLDYDYVNNLVTTLISKQHIADYLNCGMDFVRSLLDYHDLNHHNSAEVRSLLNRQHSEYDITEDNFKELHFSQWLPQSKIAILMGISPGYLRQQITTWGLTPIKGSELQLSEKFRTLRDMSNISTKLTELVKRQTLKELTTQYEVSVDAFCNLLRLHDIIIPNKYRSTAEIRLFDFINNKYNGDVEYSNKKILWPFELDIVIPELKIAIEYCGLYWHSELNGKTATYHITKQENCEKLGYRLFTIFEDEYINHTKLVENRLMQVLGVRSSVNVNARECTVHHITYIEKQAFLNEYHIQGNDISKCYLGLKREDTIVAVMTFSKPSRVRSSNAMRIDGVWELNRYATNDKYNVRGGAGKLLKFFQRNHDWITIYSYADKRWSQGDMYYKLGFKHVHDSSPNYWYYKSGVYVKREYRYKYAKYKLIEQGYDPALTEKEIMKQRGYTRVWDCGVMKFELIND